MNSISFYAGVFSSLLSFCAGFTNFHIEHFFALVAIGIWVDGAAEALKTKEGEKP